MYEKERIEKHFQVMKKKTEYTKLHEVKLNFAIFLRPFSDQQARVVQCVLILQDKKWKEWMDGKQRSDLSRKK